MATNRRSSLRLEAIVRLAVAAILVQNARAYSDASKSPKVEFIEVKGRQCLQPVVTGSDAKLTDYRAAELRWLANKYPGVPVPQSKTELVLVPATDDGRDPERTTVKRETVYLDGVVGAGAVTCFDINLTTTSGQSHE